VVATHWKCASSGPPSLWCRHAPSVQQGDKAGKAARRDARQEQMRVRGVVEAKRGRGRGEGGRRKEGEDGRRACRAARKRARCGSLRSDPARGGSRADDNRVGQTSGRISAPTPTRYPGQQASAPTAQAHVRMRTRAWDRAQGGWSAGTLTDSTRESDIDGAGRVEGKRIDGETCPRRRWLGGQISCAASPPWSVSRGTEHAEASG